MMMRRIYAAAVFMIGGIAACAVAVDLPGDEATIRKQLKSWLDDPEHAERLRRNLAAFQAMSADEQARIRQLDRALYEQKPDARERLHEVMQRYAGWLARLPESDRERVSSAPIGQERLAVVSEILDRQWQESLPKPDRARLAMAEPLERAILLDELRQNELEWRRLRADLHRKVDEGFFAGNLPWNTPEFREQVQNVIDESLRPQLNREEEARLATIRPGNRNYFLTLLDLAEGKLPIPFPGPAPPGKRKAYRYWKDLPSDIVRKFPASESSNPPPDIAKADGKWPDLPLAVVKLAGNRKIEIPVHLLGPTRAEEMPPSIVKFIRDELNPKLSEAERQELQFTEGKWPDYPKKVRELAGRHVMRLPGIGLPGDREAWQRFRNPRPNRPVPGGT